MPITERHKPFTGKNVSYYKIGFSESYKMTFKQFCCYL